MYRILFAIFLLNLALLAGCKKSSTSNQEYARGVWVKDGTLNGQADTIRFFQKNGADLITYEYGGGIRTHIETEYDFQNSALRYKLDANNYYTANSFQWITAGQRFSIQLYQLIVTMSASYTVTYHKIQ